MNRKTRIGIKNFGLLIAGTLVLSTICCTAGPIVPEAGVVIPFEWVSNHIVMKVKINNSRPLSFLLDTGNKYAIVELETAKELGLTLEGEVEVKGAGSETPKGAYVNAASFAIPGYDGFSQPVKLALPLRRLASVFGHDFDGIIGSEFIKQFVLELDYQNHKMILHDRKKFQYSGKGESIPVKLSHAGHLLVEATVVLPGDESVTGTFCIDIGSGGALLLNSPFVAERKLLDKGIKTIRTIGKVGAGGSTVGQVGRTMELRIGGFKISNPVTQFSQDKAGAHANASEMGNIGAQIMRRFNIIFDYNHDRIFLEPNASFNESFETAFTGGLSIIADGMDYHVFHITDILENSPASEAGLQKVDIIESVDGKPASDMTLTQLKDMLEICVTHTLNVRRGDKAMEVKLTPRELL
ncbi:aspartyl protease family protein [bacterium]|nr:aspartyl protease family protein [bacterium]